MRDSWDDKILWYREEKLSRKYAAYERGENNRENIREAYCPFDVEAVL